MRTKSTITINFDGIEILSPGGLFDGEEMSLPLNYTTEIVNSINSEAPALFSRGNVSGEFGLSSVCDFEDVNTAYAEFIRQLRMWRNKGVGVLSVDSLQYEAVLTSFRPRLSRACTRLVLEYNFVVGREWIYSEDTEPEATVPEIQEIGMEEER